jgi:hypothetical protein
MLFKRKKKDIHESERLSDEGAVGLYFNLMGQAQDAYADYVNEHLRRIHEPGGYAREKKENDFMELGMKRAYLDALDEVEFEVDDSAVLAAGSARAVGAAQVITEWTVRGRHARPLLGIQPSGETITLKGVSYTTFRNYYLKVEYTYWDFPELTARMSGK